MAGGSTLHEHREAIGVAVSALRALPADLWQANSGGLAELAGEVGDLHQACEAATVAVVREAVERGEPGSGPRAMTPVQWLRTHAPGWRAGGAAQVVAVAEAFAVPGNAPVKIAVEEGALPVRSAAVVVAEADKLRPLLAEGVEESVVEGLVEVAAGHGPRACRELRSVILSRYGRDGVLQAEEDAAKRFIALSRPRVDPVGVAEYRLTLDPEGRAVLEAALGPLSAPRPAEGERDLRPSERRRGEALVSLVRRAVAAGEEVGPNAKTTLLVSVGLETLRRGLSGAGVTGTGGAGLTGTGTGETHQTATGSGGVGVTGTGSSRVGASPSGAGLTATGSGGVGVIGTGPSRVGASPSGAGLTATGSGGVGVIGTGPSGVDPSPSGAGSPGVGGSGSGQTVAGSEAGVHLGPETLRRLACDATIIPTVLGGASEVVDLGRAKRLFTGGQTRRLWLRDRHCTFPGCDMPAQWTDAHHLVHWADGGATDIANAGLLCERHHTIAHSRRLASRLVRGPEGERVQWDLTTGSYDLFLAQLAAREPA